MIDVPILLPIRAHEIRIMPRRINTPLGAEDGLGVFLPATSRHGISGSDELEQAELVFPPCAARGRVGEEGPAVVVQRVGSLVDSGSYGLPAESRSDSRSVIRVGASRMTRSRCSLVCRRRDFDAPPDGSGRGHVGDVQTLIPIVRLARRRRGVRVPRRVDEKVAKVHLEDGRVDRPDVSARHDHAVCRSDHDRWRGITGQCGNDRWTRVERTASPSYS